MNVLINADDYGQNENKTKAIIDARKRGIVTTASAMANMPWFEKAMTLARENGFIDNVGLHFNVSEGVPLTEEMRECEIFCNKEGLFNAWWHRSIKTRLHLPSKMKRALVAEAKAQIERYLDCGGTLKHLDSHHRVHTDFSIAPTLFDVARHYGFKSVRKSLTIAEWIGVSKRLYKLAFNVYAGRRLGSKVNEFTDFAQFGKAYRSLGKKITVEIMTHPEYRRDGEFDLSGELCDITRPMANDAAYWKSVEAEGVHRISYTGVCHV